MTDAWKLTYAGAHFGPRDAPLIFPFSPFVYGNLLVEQYRRPGFRHGRDGHIN